MSVSMNNLFNYAKSLPEPFNTLANKKVKVSSKYGDGTGLTVVAVPGVNSLKHLKETLKHLQKNGTTKIMTCFDMDYLKNPHVRDGYHNLANVLAENGIEYGTYLWDPHFKGLDDYVWHCKQKGTL